MSNIKNIHKPLIITKPVLVNLGEMHEQLEDIWSSGWLTNNGFKHQELEESLRRNIFDNLPTSLVSNGTIGLMLALKALDLTKGEIITTPFTFPASPHAISWCGLTPVFCDIDSRSLNIDADQIEKHITKRTVAILAVHVFGIPCEVEKIEKIATRYNLKVIYDSAHAFELELNGKSIVNYGDASVFSFHATKLFHTIEGGAVVFKLQKNKNRCDLLKNFGIKNEEVVECGINGKMNELQAATGILMLTEKDKERELRATLIEEYTRKLQNVKGVILPEDDHNISKKSLQYFVIRIEESTFGCSRDVVYDKLVEGNIFPRKYFSPLCSNENYYKDLSSAKKNRLPIANRVVKEVLALPFYGGLEIKDVEYICDMIVSIKKLD